MSKFKVGDKVRVKSDLDVAKEYKCGVAFASGMNKYRGEKATIVNIDDGRPVDTFK